MRKSTQALHHTKFHGAMSKRANWRIEHAPAEFTLLDTLASKPVKYTGPGYKVRKCSR